MLGGSTESGNQLPTDYRAINRLLRFFVGSPLVGDEIETVKLKVAEYQLQNQFAGLWEGVACCVAGHTPVNSSGTDASIEAVTSLWSATNRGSDRLQSRVHAIYVDKLDGRIDSHF
jgi:hypothetical protein